MVGLDWSVIVVYFILVFGVAYYYYKKSSNNTQEFFLSGRNMPWWLAGTAMVATTFAADTPLAVTELVAKNGIAGNWLWWNLAIGSTLTVFFFAKLWRRAGILTDVEFVEMRYSGKPAAALRGFRAIYLGFFMNSIVLAWVNKAMEKIFQVTIPDFDSFTLVIICMVTISLYAASSGLLGSARIDAIQFVIAMFGSILLAVIVIYIPAVGGIDGLKLNLDKWVFDFTPNIGTSITEPILGGTLAISVGAFIAYIGVQWWASWYPGADPGGGGYIAQRMMSAKNESHSLFATLWFTIAHYCLRPWPWIIVALGALVLFPQLSDYNLTKEQVANYKVAYEQFNDAKSQNIALESKIKDPEVLKRAQEFNDPKFYESFENYVDPGKMYPKLMMRYLPSGLLGLMIAVFLAAYMSTISSQLNWGTSYIINDFYRRFFKPNAEEKHYILISRLSIVFLIIASLFITKYLLNTISGAWEFIINASAGLGAVLILRWYWWRINAWSEISAMIAPLIIYPIAKYGFGLESPITLFPIVLGTTLVWVVVTFITKPEKEEILKNFYEKIHPGGFGWKKFAKKYPNVKPDSGYATLFVNWILGIIVIYMTLFATGRIIFKDYLQGLISLAIAVVSGIIIYLNFKKQSINAETTTK